jgi:arylsulfatase A-like enzyme
VEKVRRGYTIGHKNYKVHLDGFNLAPFLKGEVEESPRRGFPYWSDDGDLLAIRVDDWQPVFEEQRHKGLAVWREPFSKMRLPKLFNLRSDHFERGESTLFYDKWFGDHAFCLGSGTTAGGSMARDLRGVPTPRQVGELQHRRGCREIRAKIVALQWIRSAPRTVFSGRRTHLWAAEERGWTNL